MLPIRTIHAGEELGRDNDGPWDLLAYNERPKHLYDQNYHNASSPGDFPPGNLLLLSDAIPIELRLKIAGENTNTNNWSYHPKELDMSPNG